MSVDWDLAKFLWTVAVTLMSGLAFALTWWDRRSRTSKETIGTIEHRITVLEQAALHAPTAQDITALREEVHTLGKIVAKQGGTLEFVANAARNMNDYLMRQK